MSAGFEYIAEKNPDYLLVIDRSVAITDKTDNAKQMLDNEIIKKTKVTKNNHIVYLDSSIWYLAFGGLESMESIVSEIESAVKK